MTRPSTLVEAITHSPTIVAAFLLVTFSIGGCAVTGPDRSRSATANNPQSCESRPSSYPENEIEVPCREPAARTRDDSAPYRSSAPRAGLYATAAILLLYLLSEDDDNDGSCSYIYYPIPCD